MMREMSLVKCEVCGREVIIGSDKEYVYVLVNIGKLGLEKPVFFHKCFPKILKKKSKLFKNLCDKEKVILT
jgi:hypothetical protein